MHAKGSGAFGKFTVTHDITKYTEADIFSEIGKETEAFVRFSTVAGERGAADAERDIRGFAMKFYTDEGYGSRLAEGLGLDLDEVVRLSKLDHKERLEATQIL